jgi:hypothetical protein
MSSIKWSDYMKKVPDSKLLAKALILKMGAELATYGFRAKPLACERRHRVDLARVAIRLINK